MINPAAKIARNERILKDKGEARRKAREKSRRRGKLSRIEKIMVGEIIKDAPNDQPSDKQIEATAVALRRSPETIRSTIAAAREKLQANALRYVDLHNDALMQAMMCNDTDVARKGAQWAIENISSRDADGKVERIVEKTEASSTLPSIRIGIALGGLPAKR